MESPETLWRVVIEYTDGVTKVQWIPAVRESEAVLRAILREFEIKIVDAVEVRNLKDLI